MNNIEILEDITITSFNCSNIYLNLEKVNKALENLIKENKDLRIQISARETVVDKLEKENKELKDKIMKLNNQNLGTQSYNDFFNK